LTPGGEGRKQLGRRRKDDLAARRRAPPCSARRGTRQRESPSSARRNRDRRPGSPPAARTAAAVHEGIADSARPGAPPQPPPTLHPRARAWRPCPHCRPRRGTHCPWRRSLPRAPAPPRPPPEGVCRMRVGHCWAATTGTRPQSPSDCRPSRRSTVPQRWGPATPFLRRFRAAVHQPTRHAPPRHTRRWTPRSKRQRATGPAGQYVSEESCGGAPPLSRGARESHRGNSECRSVVPDHVRGPNSPSAQQSTGKEGREQPRTSTAPRWWCHLLHMRQMPTWVQRKKKLGKQQD